MTPGGATYADLYAEDGRLLWRVIVPVPMPPVVVYMGAYYQWSVEERRYVRRRQPSPYWTAEPAADSEGG